MISCEKDKTENASNDILKIIMINPIINDNILRGHPVFLQVWHFELNFFKTEKLHIYAK